MKSNTKFSILLIIFLVIDFNYEMGCLGKYPKYDNMVEGLGLKHKR